MQRNPTSPRGEHHRRIDLCALLRHLELHLAEDGLFDRACSEVDFVAGQSDELTDGLVGVDGEIYVILTAGLVWSGDDGETGLCESFCCVKNEFVCQDGSLGVVEWNEWDGA
jgi:hypothetical protein